MSIARRWAVSAVGDTEEYNWKNLKSGRSTFVCLLRCRMSGIKLGMWGLSWSVFFGLCAVKDIRVLMLKCLGLLVYIVALKVSNWCFQSRRIAFVLVESYIKKQMKNKLWDDDEMTEVCSIEERSVKSPKMSWSLRKWIQFPETSSLNYWESYVVIAGLLTDPEY